MYADFANFLSKQDLCHRHQNPSPPNSSITLPCASCICMKWSDGKCFKPPQVNIEDDTAERFLDQVLAAVTIFRKHLANKIPMKQLTQEQWREYNNATNCSICVKPFRSADKKIRDHHYLTSEYRGPAHNARNLNYRINPKKVKIPCIIHNFKGILFSAIVFAYRYFQDYQFLKLILKAIFMILISIAVFYLHHILQIKVTSLFLQVFSVNLLHMLLFYIQDMMLTLYCQLLNHVMEKLLSSPTTWSATRPLLSTTSHSQTRFNLCCSPMMLLSIYAALLFINKTNYIIHYRSLKLYLELRLCVTNVHRVLLFHQSPWLKNYINFNTSQHAAAKNDFEKDFFKLMNNAVFGKSFICIDSFIPGAAFVFMIICSYVFIDSFIASKTMENLRNRGTVDWVTSEEKL